MPLGAVVWIAEDHDIFGNLARVYCIASVCPVNNSCSLEGVRNHCGSLVLDSGWGRAWYASRELRRIREGGLHPCWSRNDDLESFRDLHLINLSPHRDIQWKVTIY
jgi:hypothetical protein